MPETLASMRSTEDVEPFDFYASARAAGGVVWDEGMNAWIVTSLDACRELARGDGDLVRHPWKSMADEAMTIIEGGPRSKHFYERDAIAKYHRWFLTTFAPGAVDPWRERFIRPTIDAMIDRFAPRGTAELGAELAEGLPVRTIAAVMGLPWKDDEWIVRCKELLDSKLEYLDAFGNDPDGSIAARAVAGAHELHAMLRPFASAPPAGSDDVIAALWRDGPSILADWGEEDVVSNIVTIFFAGSDTTTHSIGNGLYLLATRPDLRDRLRAGGELEIRTFAEEVLRLYGAVQWRPRLANRDFDLAGASIKQDDLLIAVLGAANRDESHFGCPAEVDLARPSPTNHVAFFYGPRRCAGHALARAELQETFAAVLRRMPDLRLDPAADRPALKGFLMRSFTPLNVVFTPTERPDLGAEPAPVGART
jgi:cytochrome P450